MDGLQREHDMKPYEWMVNYTPQREWIVKRGILLWLAFYTGGLGGGLYLVSLFFGNLPGMVTGLLIVALLKGIFHLTYLGKPLRFWRIVWRPQTSWVSRGFIFVGLFIIFGALQVVISVLAPGDAAETIFKALAGAMAFCEMVYTGFAMNYVNGIPLWNSALLPVLFIIYGILGGLGLIVFLGVAGAGNVDLPRAEEMTLILMAAGALCLAIYLWSVQYTGETGKFSARQVILGPLAPLFWIGLILLGIIIPLIVSSLGFAGTPISPSVVSVSVLCEMIGGLSLRYLVLRGGYYNPLIPTG
jgi:formate-dependent nitrite reductase membrane component NrfD